MKRTLLIVIVLALPGLLFGAITLFTPSSVSAQDKGYEVKEISGGLYFLSAGGYNTMFLTTGQGVIAVDAPPAIGDKYLKAIEEVTKEKVTHVVLSHSHKDHIGAAAKLFPGATVVGHEAVAEILTRAKDPDRPVPTVTFKDTYTLTVGEQTLRLDYKAANHSAGNILIYAPKQKAVMLVDVFTTGTTPFRALAFASDVPGYVQSLDDLLTYDATAYIGGHGGIGTKEQAQMLRDYVQDIKANAANALKTVDTAAVSKEIPAGSPGQATTNAVQNAWAKSCADATLAKWQGKLVGAEVWTVDHCLRMVQSLRVD